jgi:hypothetical protein
MQSFKGPIQLKPKKGAAVVSVPFGKGPEVVTTGNSQVKMQRPLLSTNGHFYDEDTDKHLSPEALIREFLLALPVAVAEHEKNRVNGQCKSEDPRQSPLWCDFYDETPESYRIIAPDSAS